MSSQAFFQSNADPTKRLNLDVDGIAHSAIRTITVPDRSLSIGVAADVYITAISGMTSGNVQAALNELYTAISSINPDVQWDDILNKPTTFPPSAHSHATDGWFTTILSAKADLITGVVPAAQSQPSSISFNTDTGELTLTDATGADTVVDLSIGTSDTTSFAIVQTNEVDIFDPTANQYVPITVDNGELLLNGDPMVNTATSYSDPSWLTALSYTKLTDSDTWTLSYDASTDTLSLTDPNSLSYTTSLGLGHSSIARFESLDLYDDVRGAYGNLYIEDGVIRLHYTLDSFVFIDQVSIHSQYVSYNDSQTIPTLNQTLARANINAEAAITAGTTSQYWRGDKSWQTLDTSVVPENGNLYATNARSIAATLTGYTSGAGTVASTDSILQAIQKLNGNDALKEPSITAGTTAQYWRGDKSWQTLNQAAVAGLTTADSPTFAGLTISGTTPTINLGASNYLKVQSNSLYFNNGNGDQGVVLDGPLSQGTYSISPYAMLLPSQRWAPFGASAREIRMVGDAVYATGNSLAVNELINSGGSYANPSWVTSLAWSKITSTPTTVAGYGITDVINSTLTGYTSGAGTVASTDSILQAIQKLNGNDALKVTLNGALGTPTSGTLTNCTGLPISTGVSGLGTGVATALGVNVGSAGAFVTFNGALGTPSSGTVTNLTGTASININGTVGATTANTGAFTTLSATDAVTNAVGTITTSKPFTISQTWNASGTTFAGLLIDVTKTAAAAGSYPFNLKYNSTNYVYFDPATTYLNCMGGLQTGSGTTSNVIVLGSQILIGSSSTLTFYNASGTFTLARDAADNILAQKNGTTAQTSRLYGTYTDASNYVRSSLATTSTTITWAAESAGTGAANIDLAITPKGTGKVTTPGIISALSFQDTGTGTGDHILCAIRRDSSYNYFLLNSTGLRLGSNALINFYSGISTIGTTDLGLYRNAAGVLEINTGTSGTYRDLILRKINHSGDISATAWTTSGLSIIQTASTFTDSSSSGTVALAYSNKFGGNTIAASSATTYTKYIGSYFVNETAGTNVTFTDRYSLGTDSFWVNSGTITTSQPVLLNQTWNAGAVTFSAATINVTDTASASASLLQDWQVASTSKASLRKSGDLFVAGIDVSANNGNVANGWTKSGSLLIGLAASAACIHLDGSNGGIIIPNAAYPISHGNGNVKVWAPSSGVWEQRNLTTAQTSRLYGTYTDASNYRRLSIASTTAGAFTITPEGAGTGASGNTLSFPDTVYLSKTSGNLLAAYDTDGTTVRTTINSQGIFTRGFKCGNTSSTTPVYDAATFGTNLQIDAGTLGSYVRGASNTLFGWNSTANNANGTGLDTALARNAAGVVEINTGTAGTYRDLILRKINHSGAISSAAWTTSGLSIIQTASTFTDSSSSGTVATAYSNKFGGNTIAASSSTTFTNYVGSYFSVESAGTNVTLTNSWALGADSLRVGTSNQMTVTAAGVLSCLSVSVTGKIAVALTSLTDAATIAVDATSANKFTVTLGGNRTLGNPTGTFADGQIITFRIKQDGTGSRTLAFDTKYYFGADIPSATLSTAASTVDRISFEYDSNRDKWDCISFLKG